MASTGKITGNSLTVPIGGGVSLTVDFSGHDKGVISVNDSVTKDSVPLCQTTCRVTF